MSDLSVLARFFITVTGIETFDLVQLWFIKDSS